MFGALRRWLLAGDRAVDCVNHALNFHEFRSRPLRLVAVEGSGQHPGVGIAIFDHSFPRFFQRLEPFAHRGLIPFIFRKSILRIHVSAIIENSACVEPAPFEAK